MTYACSGKTKVARGVKKKEADYKVAYLTLVRFVKIIANIVHSVAGQIYKGRGGDNQSQGGQAGRSCPLPPPPPK